jgi:hypothetical protein
MFPFPIIFPIIGLLGLAVYAKEQENKGEEPKSEIDLAKSVSYEVMVRTDTGDWDNLKFDSLDEANAFYEAVVKAGTVKYADILKHDSEAKERLDKHLEAGGERGTEDDEYPLDSHVYQVSDIKLHLTTDKNFVELKEQSLTD